MVLFIIGLGLSDERDITVKGLECVRSCTKVYLEAYTSILNTTPEKLQEFYGVPVIVADRMLVESQAEEILTEASTQNVGFLVIGDPFSATTHMDLYIRAKALGIHITVVHNASILTAVGAAGLFLYRYGEVVSVPFFTEKWRPLSFYEKIVANKARGLHTLVLLDIKVKEQSEEDLVRGRLVFQPPRFMSVKQACEQIVEAEEHYKSGTLSLDTEIVAVVRMGSEQQLIVAKPLRHFLEADLGPPLHSLVIPGEVSEVENEILELHRGN